MQFRLDSTDTIGPLQLEFVIALVVAAAIAILAAMAVWTLATRFQDHRRALLYGGVVALLAGALLAVLPGALLTWLYAMTHPQAVVCIFVVWPGLLLPLLTYAITLWHLLRKERKLQELGA